jgi:hypothetical protein
VPSGSNGLVGSRHGVAGESHLPGAKNRPVSTECAIALGHTLSETSGDLQASFTLVLDGRSRRNSWTIVSSPCPAMNCIA